MKINMKIKDSGYKGRHHIWLIADVDDDRGMTLDEIEDLEINLTDIIKQLQDYRMKQNHD
jgi:hypothetical protein